MNEHLLHELDSCKPLYNAIGPAQGGRTFSGWEVPDWLTQRVRDALNERKEDTDALHLDRAGVALVDTGDVPTSRSAAGWLTSPERAAERDSGPQQTETPGHSPESVVRDASGAPTGSFPPGPVGAPSPERVP